jgi:hypothetical protein
MWLEKDGKVEFHADSAAALASGWAEPKGVRGNGAEWNPASVDGELSQAEALAKSQETKLKKKAK